MKARPVATLLILLMSCAAPQLCRAAQTEPLDMSPLFQLNPTDPGDVAEQTRVFPTGNQDEVLFAGAAALQDMGFSITGGEKQFGLLIGEKNADVEGAGAVHAVAEAAVVALSLVGSLIAGQDMTTDLPEQISQVIHVSLLVSESDDGNATVVRISLDRDMIYDQGFIIADHTELPRVYQDFFDKLSKAIYLEVEIL